MFKLLLLLSLLLGAAFAPPLQAQAQAPQPASVGSAGSAAPAPAASSASAPPAMMGGDPRALQRPVPLVLSRLRAADIGLLINTQDPYSVAVGAYYAARRGLSPQQILRVSLPVRAALTPDEFAGLQEAIDMHFGFRAQALALAWVGPYAVDCNSLGGALALGFDAKLCHNSCQASRPSPYANSRAARPYSELRLRLSMHLAAPTVDDAKALIDRGVMADGSLYAADTAAADALLVQSNDRARNVRHVLYPPEGARILNRLQVQQPQGLAAAFSDRLMVLSVGTVGTVGLEGLPGRGWLPGALADHLTSLGGDLLGGHNQGKAWQWIRAGATASHGTVSEPCNHLHKFPHPVWLMGHYAQGSTAIEAYWKSVAWPQQSMFIGEPLAAPFARAPEREAAAPEPSGR